MPSPVDNVSEGLGSRIGKILLTFADVQVHDQGAQRISQGCHGVDFAGDAGWVAVLRLMLAISKDRHDRSEALHKTHHFRKLLDESINDSIAELLVLQTQAQQI